MAGTFTPTGSYSNLTRRELEQLRKADFTAGGKALTVGDDGTVVGGTGVGSINAEPYATAPSLSFNDLFVVPPPPRPGTQLQLELGIPTTGNLLWYGPTVVASGIEGVVGATDAWRDPTADFTGMVGNLLVVRDRGYNANCTANISSITLGNTQLVLTSIVNASNPSDPTHLGTQLDPASYLILAPGAVQLFAVPGSGPLGQEQTFLTVKSGSTLHASNSPSLDAINADRIINLVTPNFSADTGVDRADAIFEPPAGAGTSIDTVGYRLVIYKSLADGSGPDYTSPIASLNPTIDSTLPAADQRMTVDYHAGVVRFSCAPRAGDGIKPSGGNGGTNATTGRLQLWAVFWAVDASQSVQAEEKTSLMVGGGSQNPSRDYNATLAVSQPVTGIRDLSTALPSALLQSIQGGAYSTVHLRRGTYRNDSVVTIPPGVILEGDGFGTLLEGIGTIRFGANTKWGVYDPTADSAQTTVTPSRLFFTSTVKIVGYDIVWNKARRVWGVFVADALTNTLWFNELNLDGTWVFPSPGIDVSQSPGMVFYTQDSDNSTHLTDGHYPRASHNALRDEYAVVFSTEYDYSGIGPQTLLRVISYDGTQVGATRYPLKCSITMVTSGPSFHSAHPSVASEQSTSDTYEVVVSSFAYDQVSFSGTNYFTIQVVDTSSSTYTTTTNSRPQWAVISSTDVTFMGASPGSAKFIATWSERQHPVYYGFSGETDGSSIFSDPTENPDFAAIGVVVGSRFVITNHLSVPAIRGLTGWIGAVATGDLYLQFEGAELEAPYATSYLIPDSLTNIYYIVAPVCRVYGLSVTGGTPSVASKLAGPDTTTTSGTYYMVEREPDFVRISAGVDGRAIIVYQNFDTRGGICRKTIQNFDNGVETSYVGVGGIEVGSFFAVREHLSTSYVIVTYELFAAGGDGFKIVLAPSQTESEESRELMTNLSTGRRANDLEVIRRSLGGRNPMLPYPNGKRNNTLHPWDEVSARNYSLEIVSGKIPSFIPDVTWSGSDWTIVSPTVDYIHSRTGYYLNTGTPYLLDATFLFWGENTNTDVMGRMYRKTVQVYSAGIGDTIYIPAQTIGASVVASQTRTILAVVDEHTVTLDAAIMATPSLPSGSTNINWYLIRDTGGYGDGLPKTPGYRVGLNGEVIISSTYATWADERDTSDTGRASQEVLNRNLWGNTYNPNYTSQGYSALKFGFPLNTWNDLVEGGRFVADLGFNGVAVGAPRLTTPGPTTGIVNETYSVAISWGETLFGFIDREKSSSGKSIRAFRQSFGPFNSGLKNLTLKSNNSIEQIDTTSRNLVYTRHGLTGCPNPHFATDGYRTVFLHLGVWSYGSIVVVEAPGVSIGESFDPRLRESYCLSVCAVFSDVTGKHSIRKRVLALPPGAQVYSGYGSSFQINHRLNDIPGDISEAYYPSDVRKPTFGGRVIWTGKTFLGLVVLPKVMYLFDLGNGEEDTELDNALTGEGVVRDATLYNFELNSIQGLALIDNGGGGSPPGPITNIAQFNVQCSGDRRSIEINDVTEVATAWSGNVLAVVWISGLNTTPISSGTNPLVPNSELGTPTLGVTLFHFGTNLGYITPGISGTQRSSTVNATSYLIDVATGVGNFDSVLQDPTILWDGNSFVVNCLAINGSTNYLKSFRIPEVGLQSNHQLIHASGLDFIDLLNPTGNPEYLGTIGLSGNFILNENLRVKPGDLIVIQRTALLPSILGGDYLQDNLPATTGADPVFDDATHANWAGTYTVKYYSAKDNYVDLGVNFNHDGITGSGLFRVYGQLISGDGVSASKTALGSANRAYSEPAGMMQEGTAISSYFADQSGLGVGPSLLWGTFYNEKRGEYAAFYSKSGVLYAASIDQRGRRSAEVRIDLPSTITNDSENIVSVEWNGDHYIVVVVSSSNPGYMPYFRDSVDYILVSQNFGTIAKSRTLTSRTDLVGTDIGQVPGPGYGTPDALNYLPTYQITSTQPVWNSKLCQWQISITVGWFSEFVNHYRYNGLSNVAGLDSATNGAVYSNRSITFLSATLFRQPGLRWLGVQYTPVIASHSITLGLSTDPPDPASTSVTTAPSWQGAGLLGDTPPHGPLTGNKLYMGGSSINSFVDTYFGVVQQGHLAKITYGGLIHLRRITLNSYRFFWYGIGAVDYIYLDGALYPYNPASQGASLQVDAVSKQLLIHSIRSPSATEVQISTKFTTDLNPPITPDNTYRWYCMGREDVFLFNVGVSPSVVVQDADGVSIDNVMFQGGSADVSEFAYRMGRPFWKVGGLTLGSPVTSMFVFPPDGNPGQRPHVATVTPTPLGKVEVLRFTNVKSTTRGKYDYLPSEIVNHGKKGR